MLKNRGICDADRYMNLSENCLCAYSNLDNILTAVELFDEHFIHKDKIAVLVDTDPDGYCSAAMLYNYIKQMDKNYPLIYIIHGNPKSHGLSEDVVVPDDISFLIIPDAGTNDTEKCKELKNRNIDVLILDHHEKEDENPYAVIVNNQISQNYSNKALSGAGIVYKFLQALDEYYWNDYADNYLDLCAVANISDVMDMRSYETKYLVEKGLHNIKNKCLKAFLDKQSYVMQNNVNIHNIQWYVTPLLNGLIRTGTFEEKKLLFKALTENYEEFDYIKRGEAFPDKEDIYTKVVRLASNTKSKQDRLRKKAVSQINLSENINPDNKVILLDVTETLDESLTGLTASTLAQQYNKPCFLVRKYTDSSGKTVYRGSARNVKHSPISSLKNIAQHSQAFTFAKGHANAFGVGLTANEHSIEKAKGSLNSILKDVVFDSVYYVDYILYPENIDAGLIREFDNFNNFIGEGIDEPMIAIENIELKLTAVSNTDNLIPIKIIGKASDTIKFEKNGIEYIIFDCRDNGDKNKLLDFANTSFDNASGNKIRFTVVGTPKINRYNGIATPQILVKDMKLEPSETEVSYV